MPFEIVGLDSVGREEREEDLSGINDVGHSHYHYPKKVPGAPPSPVSGWGWKDVTSAAKAGWKDLKRPFTGWKGSKHNKRPGAPGSPGAPPAPPGTYRLPW
jgi:hypothetical protein